MAPVIIVDLDFVATLRDDTNTTCETLRGDNGYSARTSTCGEVDDKLGDFMGKWDERRGELADTLDAVSQMATAIYDGFSGTQDELIAGLNGEGG
ncbi:MAG: hypothetical protein M3Q72_04770 [Actinomycetota bacterium]|nr:hypothetical protein [Actinomycetota bacterium]